MNAFINDLEEKRFFAATQERFSLAIMQEVDSTNARMKAWARGEEALFPDASLPAVLIADRQTAGRGRLGRTFHSPGGTGLYMTIALPVSPPDSPPLTIAAAVAVCGALEARGFAPAIKWVNDLFIDHKKVCGILAERIDDIVIVGIGVNVRAPEGGFPDEIRDIAGALCGDIRRDELAGDIAGRLIAWAKKIGHHELIDEYIKRMPLVGREIVYQRDAIACVATVIGIDRLGGLIVKSRDGIESVLRVGEISLGSGNIFI